ncbi:hypothetical protein T265_10367 [Opisthorchis viverrini]|uniref:Uncharacterized protein n=1 Tax=Opisthorchis viverrini TaxID=6198 RepID=A0A074ZDI5_OPIVI|nr:hypothetical protein T265_10367 [Opisthorchis viverrini]KER21265.1 hypothetical protein T265_10367 [Opisthorchis viverrini]
MFEKNRSAVAPFRGLNAMPPEGSTRAGIRPGWPSLDRTDNAPSICSASQPCIKPRQLQSALIKDRQRLRNMQHVAASPAPIATATHVPHKTDPLLQPRRHTGRTRKRVEPLQLDPRRKSYVERSKGGSIRKVSFLKATTECPESTATCSSAGC